MGTRQDIDALLRDALEIRQTLGRLHDDAVGDPRLMSHMQPKIKSFLEHHRSALDYLAAEIVSRYGKAREQDRIYYPLSRRPAHFAAAIRRSMPGVMDARIAESVKARQPWNREPLAHLAELSNPNKHKRLSVQLVREVRLLSVTDKPSGYVVRFLGAAIRPGVLVSPAGGSRIELLRGVREPEHPPLKMNGPFGPAVFGVPFDQDGRPLPSPRLDVQEAVVTEWCFFNPYRGVLVTLDAIHQEVAATIDAVAQAARLS